MDFPNLEEENLTNFLETINSVSPTLKVIRLTFTGHTNDCLIKLIKTLTQSKKSVLEKVILDYSISITKNKKFYLALEKLAKK